MCCFSASTCWRSTDVSWVAGPGCGPGPCASAAVVSSASTPRHAATSRAVLVIAIPPSRPSVPPVLCPMDAREAAGFEGIRRDERSEIGDWRQAADLALRCHAAEQDAGREPPWAGRLVAGPVDRAVPPRAEDESVPRYGRWQFGDCSPRARDRPQTRRGRSRRPGEDDRNGVSVSAEVGACSTCTSAPSAAGSCRSRANRARGARRWLRRRRTSLHLRRPNHPLPRHNRVSRC